MRPLTEAKRWNCGDRVADVVHSAGGHEQLNLHQSARRTAADALFYDLVGKSSSSPSKYLPPPARSESVVVGSHEASAAVVAAARKPLVHCSPEGTAAKG
jgi:hypothetical protein